MASFSIKPLFFSFPLFFLFLSFTHSATITLQNNCTHTIWPGILSGAGTAPLSTTGFPLLPGATSLLSLPTAWSGRIWARTFCSTDSSGRFSCATADCVSGLVECNGACAAPPATLAEFTLNGGGGFDFYDVSLVDGYNIAMQIVPEGGKSGNCTATGCIADLNGDCPEELQVVMGGGEDGRNRSVACKSACVAFGKAEYCCSGAFANPNTCKPSNYSKFFKNNCPLAYSYAFDDGTSTFTCMSANYVVTFCPSPLASFKASSKPQPQAADVSGSRRRAAPPCLAILTAVWVAVWRLRHRNNL
ncbi:Thaumatin-like protein 1, partial [Cucurbita argyrosperma subsp. sororia]